jgi:hypothetical protein
VEGSGHNVTLEVTFQHLFEWGRILQSEPLEFKAEFLVTEPGRQTSSLKDSGAITTFIILDIIYLRRQELALSIGPNRVGQHDEGYRNKFPKHFVLNKIQVKAKLSLCLTN